MHTPIAKVKAKRRLTVPTSYNTIDRKTATRSSTIVMTLYSVFEIRLDTD